MRLGFMKVSVGCSADPTKYAHIIVPTNRAQLLNTIIYDRNMCEMRDRFERTTGNLHTYVQMW